VPAGKRLRPQEVGALAAFGIVEVPVFRRPRVGILSTGNEVVPADAAPRPGQVRCMNQFTLAAQARRCGAEVRLAGIAPDEAEEIRRRTAALLEDCDLVMLSGGSSVGVRDLTAGVLEALGATIIFHGISVRPGKPTILARRGDKPILGMPGVPVSAMVIFDVFLRPLLWTLGGERAREPWPARRRARLSRRVPSVAGREDYIRVTLSGERADPLMGGSAAVSTLTKADGFVVVPANVEGLGEGEDVEVLLYA
jgi:molybdopterin molybdotransferase